MNKYIESQSLNKLITNYKISSVLIQFTFLVFPLSMYLVYNKIIASKNPNALLVILLFLLFILSLQLILKIFTCIQKNLIKTKQTIASQEKYIDKSFQESRQAYYGDHHDINQIAQLQDSQDEEISSQINTSFYILICLYFILIIIVGKILFIVPLLVFSINYIIMRRISIKQAECRVKLRESLARKNNFLKEILLKNKVIKSLNINEKIVQKYQQISFDYHKYKCYNSYLTNISSRSALALNIVNMSFIIIFGRYLFSLDVLSINEVITCSLLTIWISKPVSQIFANIVAGYENQLKTNNQYSNPNQYNEQIYDDLKHTINQNSLSKLENFITAHKNQHNTEDSDSLRNTEAKNPITNQNNLNNVVVLDKDTDLIAVQNILIKNNYKCSYINSNFNIFYGSIINNITLFDNSLTNQAKDICRYLGFDKLIRKIPFQYNYVTTSKYDEIATKDILIFISIIRELLSKPDYLILDLNTKIINANLVNSLVKYCKENDIKIIGKNYTIEPIDEVEKTNIK